MADVDDHRQVTRLLQAWAGGDRDAGDRLFPLIYQELRAISERQLRRSSAQITLQPTDVLHEAYLRLADQRAVSWRDRTHFFALGAIVIRRVLLDHARYRLAARRDRREEVDLHPDHEPFAMTEARADEVLRLDEALEELAALDPRRARVVELRFFGGLNVDETAAAMNISAPTVKRDWAFARAWLRRRITLPDEGPE